MPEIPTSWMASEPDTYSIESLTALDDSALNELAAELRGAVAVETTLYGEWRARGKKAWVAGLGFPDREAVPVTDWTPATDRNQSGELLQRAAKQGVRTTIKFGNYSGAVDDGDFIRCRLPERFTFRGFDLGGNDARAETIAFCAAMLAMAGRLK